MSEARVTKELKELAGLTVPQSHSCAKKLEAGVEQKGPGGKASSGDSRDTFHFSSSAPWWQNLSG